MKSKEALERVKTMCCPPTAYSSCNDGIGWFLEDIELIKKDLEVLEILRQELLRYYDKVRGDFTYIVELTTMKPKNAKIVKEWLEND